MTRTQLLFAGALLVAAGAIGFSLALWMQNDMPMEAPGVGGEERSISHWVAPMDPNFRSDGPGKSPMGMDLIPVYLDEGLGSESNVPSIRINPAVVSNVGVRTAQAVRSTLHRRISAVGSIVPNENDLGHVHIRAPGWIEELVIKAVGEEVSAGDLLFRFYSPDLVSAQAEYLQTRRRGNQALIEAARERLISLGVAPDQISNIEQTGRVQRLVDVRAHHSGTVLELGAREGKYVVPADMIMNLADLSSVWVFVDLFEDEAALVEKGQAATMRLDFTSSQVWQGAIDYVYPTVDAAARTVRTRIVLDNLSGTLKPNMYVNVTIEAAPEANSLAIPQSALIRASTGDRVILALGEGRFRPARVVAGIESGDQVQILEGLAVGETVVTSGQFLIDSEASLDASLLRLTTPNAQGEQR